MALGGIGAKRINDFDDNTDTKSEVIQCRLYYEQTKKALIRSHYWRFAQTRANLSQDTETPAFEYDYQYKLPNDFLRLKSFYADNNTPTKNTRYNFAIEGQRLLTNDSSVSIRYIKNVDDPNEFDPLFVEVLVLQLQLKMIMPLTQDAKLKESIKMDIREIMPKVRVLDRQETNTSGRLDNAPWFESRYSDLYRQNRS